MATYAAEDDLFAYVADDRVALRGLRAYDDAMIETLLERGERAVDNVIGGDPPDPVTGLRLDPATLTVAQQGALSRAVCAYCQWELHVGRSFVVGDSVEVPNGLAIASPAARTPPAMLAELSGFGLMKRSGTVHADPAPTPPTGHPWCSLDARAPHEA